LGVGGEGVVTKITRGSDPTTTIKKGDDGLRRSGGGDQDASKVIAIWDAKAPRNRVKVTAADR